MLNFGPLTSHSASLSDIAQRNTSHLQFAPDVLLEVANRFPGKPTALDIFFEVLQTSWGNLKVGAQVYAPKPSAAVEKAFADAGRRMAASMSRGRRLLAFCESQRLDPKANIRIVNDDFPFARARHHTTWNGTLVEAYVGNLLATSIEDRTHFVVYLPGIRHMKISSPHVTIRQIETK